MSLHHEFGGPLEGRNTRHPDLRTILTEKSPVTALHFRRPRVRDQPESLSTPDIVGSARCVDLLLTPSDGYVTCTRNGEKGPRLRVGSFRCQMGCNLQNCHSSLIICAPRTTKEGYSHSFRVVLPSKGTLYKHRAFHIANQSILT
jgi:hypothetical protein